MISITEKKLVWWRDVPIDVETGLLKFISGNWNNEIYVVSANGYGSERKICAWDIGGFKNVHMLIGNLNEKTNKEKISNLLSEDAVHLFSGVKGGQKKYLDILNKQKKHKCVFIMESPSLYGSKLRKLIKGIAYPIIYGWYARHYQKIACGLFAMGEDAVKTYCTYGWNIVFDFMYLPDYRKLETKTEHTDVVKLLYIGRFDYSAKGVDVLMTAISKITPKCRWRLDMVGGYGLQKEQVIEWAECTDNIFFLGAWPSDSVVKRMADYDFCIVPSNYDGWNITPLQCLNAGIGCIITDNAGSNELIKRSGAGVVIDAGNCKALAEQIENAIDNKMIIDKWKENARTYAENVSVESVGNYFIECLKYCFGENQTIPQCPW